MAYNLNIRPAKLKDAPLLQEIDLATQDQFAAIGYEEVAASPPDSIELLVEDARAGRSWVAVVEDEVVGYILVGVAPRNSEDIPDGAAYVALSA